MEVRTSVKPLLLFDFCSMASTAFYPPFNFLSLSFFPLFSFANFFASNNMRTSRSSGVDKLEGSGGERHEKI